MIQSQLLTVPQPHKLHSDSHSDVSTDLDDLEPLHDSSNSPFPINHPRSTKAKSSLCKNYMQKGYCPYGNKCQFAHGPQELRINMETNRSYKTKGCHAFAKKGYCCYGDRCNFIHQADAPPQEPRQRWSMIYSNHRETFFDLWCSQGSKMLGLLGLSDHN